MSSKSAVSVFLVGAFFLCLLSTKMELSNSCFWSNSVVSCFQCPTSDEYNQECLKSALPPWPICLFHDVEYFVSKAKDGATRCCTGDLSECQCPKKDTPAFRETIESWCQGVQACMPCSTGENCEEESDNNSKSRVNSLQEDEPPLALKAHISSSLHYSSEFLEDDFNEQQQQQRQLSSQQDCPTDDRYGTECLESAVPPYPIFFQKTAAEWVEKAFQGHVDCCGEDLSTCQCPQKNSDQFASKIGDWCAGVLVETCSEENEVVVEEISAITTASATATSRLRSTNQQQQEERPAGLLVGIRNIVY